MKFIMLIALCFLSACTTVKSISYTSLTRGFRKEILVTSKEIRLTEQKMSSDEKVTCRQLTKEDWNSMISSLRNVKLREIDSLNSPTNRRLYDGALASALVIKSKSGKTYQHGFDDADPHAKLKPVVNEILKILPQ